MSNFDELPRIPGVTTAPVAGFTERDTDPMAVVRFTQQMRYMATEKLTVGGTQIPDKMGDLIMLLNGMDQSALTTRKLDIEEKIGDNGAEAIKAVREIREMFGGRDPFLAVGEEREITGERISSILPEGYVPPEVSFKPGERDSGESSLDVSDFVSPDE
jgi:hypothetical protein